MKKTWVKDLIPGLAIDDVFVLRKKELRDYEGGNFLKLELGDKTGRVDAVAWNQTKDFYRLAGEGDFLQVKGSASTYKDFVQIRVDSLARISPEKVELADFLPRSSKDPRDLLETWRREALQLQNPHLRKLLEKILADREIVERLLKAPGGKLWHHNYLGGLLEHTLKIVEICKKASELYPQVDRDLLIAGALLHDIGKISQYQVTSLIEFSDEGRLVGHIVEGDRIVTDRIRQIENFPEELAMKLRHLILSHQGQLETGSPVVPQTMEAIILHFADEMDAKAGAFARIIQEEKDSDKRWSSYVSLINRYIYLGDKKEQGNRP
jgi:3'-5' exoribonuclease